MKFNLFHKITIIHKECLVLFKVLRGPDRTHSRDASDPWVVHPDIGNEQPMPSSETVTCNSCCNKLLLLQFFFKYTHNILLTPVSVICIRLGCVSLAFLINEDHHHHHHQF